jgi:hypothetical protein
MSDQPKPQSGPQPAQGGAQEQPAAGPPHGTQEPPPQYQMEYPPGRREGVVSNPDPESTR